MDGEQVEEQQGGFASESDGFLRGARLEHHNARVDAVGRILQVPVDSLLLRNLEARVQAEDREQERQ